MRRNNKLGQNKLMHKGRVGNAVAMHGIWDRMKQKGSGMASD